MPGTIANEATTAPSSVKTAAQFAELDKVVDLAVPIAVVDASGNQKVVFLVFEDLPGALDTDTLFTPEGEVHLCAFHGVLVDCAQDDYVSRNSVPLNVENNFDNAVLLSLNSENSAGFAIEKNTLMENNVVPLLTMVQIEKQKAAMSKATDAFRTVSDFRTRKGLKDREIQSLLLGAKNLAAFNDMAELPAEELRKLT